MDFNYMDNKTLTKLHLVEVEILDEIVRICEKNKINYFLIGGTLLGAKRHDGFIPWDDDIDIGMLRSDYDKFIEICDNELNDEYYLDCIETNNDFHLPFAKIRKKNTLIDEQAIAHLNIKKGIFVDIFPFDNTNKAEGFLFKFRSFLIRSIVETIFLKKKISKKSRHPLMVGILLPFSNKFLMIIQKKIMKINRNNSSKYITNYVGTYSCLKESFERKEAFPLKKISFEGKNYNCFKNPEKYLTNIYGDYMKLPPVEKRVNHNAVEISFDLKNREKK